MIYKLTCPQIKHIDQVVLWITRSSQSRSSWRSTLNTLFFHKALQSPWTWTPSCPGQTLLSSHLIFLIPQIQPIALAEHCYLHFLQSISNLCPDFGIISHLTQPDWSRVWSPVIQVSFIAPHSLFPPYPLHSRPDGLLKTPNLIHAFIVSSWAESLSPRKSLTTSGKILFLGLRLSEHSHPLSDLHLGKTKLVCFLQTSPFLFPKTLFCLMLPPIWSLASSFLSLLLMLDPIWKDSILWTAIAPSILEIHWHLPFRCSCFLLDIRLLLLWSHTLCSCFSKSIIIPGNTIHFKHYLLKVRGRPSFLLMSFPNVLTAPSFLPCQVCKMFSLRTVTTLKVSHYLILKWPILLEDYANVGSE